MQQSWVMCISYPVLLGFSLSYCAFWCKSRFSRNIPYYLPGGLQYFTVTHKIGVWDGMALSKITKIKQKGNLVSIKVLILGGVEQFLKVLTTWTASSVE